MKLSACQIALCVLLSCACSLRAAQPSANADKRGEYTVSTSVNDQYNYHVYVPESYDPQKGAGIHLFFHGRGKGGGIDTLNRWKKEFADPFGLILINMQYLDGRNQIDTAGKVKAAQEAIQQVMADYHVIPGRGVIASFSGGGVTVGMWYRDHGNDYPSIDWPFSCVTLYGSNFWTSPSVNGGFTHSSGATIKPTREIAWFIAVGEDEWLKGDPVLGDTGIDAAVDLANGVRQGGFDFVFRTEHGKAHTITEADRQAAAALFRRHDLTYGPFVYSPQFTDSAIQPLAQRANALQLGYVLKSLDKTLSNDKISEDTRKQAELLKAQVEERAAAVLALGKELQEKDPLLFLNYQKQIEGQLKDTPQEDEWKQVVQAYKKSGKDAEVKRAVTTLLRVFPKLFAPRTPGVPAEAVPNLEAMVPMFGPESSYGVMITEWLAVPPRS